MILLKNSVKLKHFNKVFAGDGGSHVGSSSSDGEFFHFFFNIISKLKSKTFKYINYEFKLNLIAIK